MSENNEPFSMARLNRFIETHNGYPVESVLKEARAEIALLKSQVAPVESGADQVALIRQLREALDQTSERLNTCWMLLEPGLRPHDIPELVKQTQMRILEIDAVLADERAIEDARQAVAGIDALKGDG